jgi:hypothetical protein
MHLERSVLRLEHSNALILETMQKLLDAVRPRKETKAPRK